MQGQIKVSRIQLTGALHIPQGVRPSALPPVNPRTHFVDLWVVRQSASCNSKLGPGAGVIEISPIKMQRQSQMRLARIRIRVRSEERRVGKEDREGWAP